MGNSGNRYFNQSKKLVDKDQNTFKWNPTEYAYVLCYNNIKARVVGLNGDNVILTRESLKSTTPGRELLHEVDKYTTRSLTDRNKCQRKYNGAFSIDDHRIRVPLDMVYDE